MSVVLMYHAIFRDNADLARIDAVDQPYAVSLADFTAHMDIVANMRHGILGDTGDALPDVIVSFDDGHISNVEHALPVLERFKLRAYFFVTTGFIGKRAHFCGWDDLQQLVDSDMIVGSHGTSHGFFDDMTPVQTQRELGESKQLIEQQLGHNVMSVSFPGGRYTDNTLHVARELGYHQLFGSDFGRLTANTALQRGKPVKRVPLRQSTSLARFDKLVRADRMLFAIETTKSRSKQAIKKALGNRIYHGLYSALAKNR